MKKINLLALLMFISLSVSPVFAANTASKSAATTTEMDSKLTQEEVTALTARVEEIREMDKSEMTATEKSELKSELKDIKETMKSSDPYIYIGGSTLLILIIVLIILL